MTKLNDTMRILLAAAAQRETGNLLPLPASLVASPRVTRAIAALASFGFAIEQETGDLDAVHRTDGDLRYAMVTTAAGLAAIGIVDEPGDVDGAVMAVATVAQPASSKRAAVIALLTADTGATMAELIAATAWLPHTTRAALTSLRKAGHVIERSKRDGDTCYRIVTSA